MRPQRIAVVNFTRMGDLIQSGPFLRSLKNAHPDSSLTLIVFESFREVAERLPMVDETAAFDVDHVVPRLDPMTGDPGETLRYIREWLMENGEGNFDVVFNLSHTSQAAWLCALMEPKIGWGMWFTPNGHRIIRGDWFAYLFSVMADRTLNPFNLTEIYWRIEEKRTPSGLEFRVSEEDHLQATRLLSERRLSDATPYAVLQPGANEAARRWPVENVARLAELLGDRGIRSVVVGSESERVLCEEVEGNSHGQAVSIAGRTSLGTLAAVLKHALCVVSNDTGTIHLAAAVETRTVGVFLGPASAKDTAPYASGHVIVEADLPCAPCSYHSTCVGSECHARVRPDQIAALVLANEEQLRGIAASMTQIRVYQTELHSNGELALHGLNRTRSGYDWPTLEFYRTFWDALMNRDRDVAPAGMTMTTETEGIAELDRICHVASQSLEDLLAVLRDDGNVDGCLRRFALHHSAWQTELQRVMSRFPPIAPFARFLLIRLNAAPSSPSEDYLEDVQQTLLLLARGNALFKRAAKARQAHEARAYA